MICKYIKNRMFWKRYRLYKSYKTNKDIFEVCRKISESYKAAVNDT